MGPRGRSGGRGACRPGIRDYEGRLFSDQSFLGRLPRADRLAVVREVEGQVYELLGERPGHELDREDVLTVLAKLDPPEAYIPEEGGYEPGVVLLPARTATPAGQRPPEAKPAMVVGILGLLLFGLVMFWPVTYLLAGLLGEKAAIALLAGESFVMVAGGVAIFILSIVWRKGGAWAVVGLVGGIVGVLAGLASAGLLILALG